MAQSPFHSGDIWVIAYLRLLTADNVVAQQCRECQTELSIKPVTELKPLSFTFIEEETFLPIRGF